MKSVIAILLLIMATQAIALTPEDAILNISSREYVPCHGNWAADGVTPCYNCRHFADDLAALLNRAGIPAYRIGVMKKIEHGSTYHAIDVAKLNDSWIFIEPQDGTEVNISMWKIYNIATKNFTVRKEILNEAKRQTNSFK